MIPQYQKKYLFLVMGGEATCLRLLARSPYVLGSPGAAGARGVVRFRTAALAVIAVSRLRFLCKKWRIRKEKVSRLDYKGSASGASRNLVEQLERLTGRLSNC